MPAGAYNQQMLALSQMHCVVHCKYTRVVTNISDKMHDKRKGKKEKSCNDHISVSTCLTSSVSLIWVSDSF